MKAFTVHRWQPHEDSYLRSHAATTSISQMSRDLRRHKSVVQKRLQKLGITQLAMPKKPRWGKKDIQTLQGLIEKHCARDIAQLMGRTEHSIRGVMARLGWRQRCDVFSLNAAAESTGYHWTQLWRAKRALNQAWRWEKFRGLGRYSISSEQLDQLCEYLKTEGSDGPPELQQGPEARRATG